MPLKPGDIYALTKGMGDQMCRGYFRSQGLPVTIFRFAMTLADDEILTFPQFRVAHWRQVYASKTGEAAATVRDQFAAADDNTLLIARDETGRSYKKHVADGATLCWG